MAEHFPHSQIVSVSNSSLQKQFIDTQAAARRLHNLQVSRADMNAFGARGKCDRAISVEMFEQMRNYQARLSRIASWMQPDAKLFVHIFSHSRFAYPSRSATTATGWRGISSSVASCPATICYSIPSAICGCTITGRSAAFTTRRRRRIPERAKGCLDSPSWSHGQYLCPESRW